MGQRSPWKPLVHRPTSGNPMGFEQPHACTEWIPQDILLLIQVSTLLQERASTIYIQHVWSQSPLPGPTSEGNVLPDQTASTGIFMGSSEQPDQFHSCPNTNIKGLHAHFPCNPVAQLQSIIKTCSSCASLITTPSFTNDGLKLNALW